MYVDYYVYESRQVNINIFQAIWRYLISWKDERSGIVQLLVIIRNIASLFGLAWLEDLTLLDDFGDFVPVLQIITIGDNFVIPVAFTVYSIVRVIKIKQSNYRLKKVRVRFARQPVKARKAW